MPCYDSRDSERQVPVTTEDRLRLFREWHHNSPVAELLCSVMKELSNTARRELCLANPKLAHWWKDHQERDAGKKLKPKGKA